MSEARLQDWIRYVQEKAENVPQEPASKAVERMVARHEKTRGKVGTAAPPSSSASRAAQSTSIDTADIATTNLPSLPVEIIPLRGTTERKPRTSGSREKGQGGAKQRQRLRPENRAQMMERLTNPLISLHEASVLLGVCAATVRRYTISGVLPHVRTTGGQRRFRLRDVLALERDRKAKRK
jgi:excisionase family DNA binding protein